MATWITSDLHFNHKNILRFNSDTRKFATSHDMDVALIAEWQDKVKPDDVIYDLGDFSFAGPVYTRAVIEQLPGRKIHVYGNHDNVIRKNKDISDMFESCHDYLEINHNGVHICMFHYPIAEFNKQHHGSIHFHGHLHGKPSGLEHYRVRDVSWDAQGGQIMLLDDVIASALTGEVKSHH